MTARGWGTGRMEFVLSGYGVAVWEKEKSSRDGWWGGCRTMRMHLMPQSCTVQMAKVVSFTCCVFYHQKKVKSLKKYLDLESGGHSGRRIG